MEKIEKLRSTIDSLVSLVKQAEENRVNDFKIINNNFQTLSDKVDLLASGTKQGFEANHKGIKAIQQEIVKIQTTTRYQEEYNNMIAV